MSNDATGHLDAITVVRNLAAGKHRDVAVLAVDTANPAATILALAEMVRTLAGDDVEQFLDAWTSSVLRVLPPDFDPGDFGN